MGTKYSTVTVSGYNATPPIDDGTVSEANKIKWSTIKTKLPDPLKTAIEAVDSRLQTHFNIGPTALTSNTTLGASHYNQIIQVSGASVTLTLTDAATLGAGWYCRIVNTDGSNNVTIGRATGGDTINGTAANFTLTALHGIDVFVNAAATGFFLRSIVINPVTTDTTQTITGVKTFTTSTVGGAPIILESTDASSTAGPELRIYRNSASPAASDDIGTVTFEGEDSAGNTETYTRLRGHIVDATSTSEDGRLVVQTVVAGALADRAYVQNGLVLGSPTGGDQGLGTSNVTGYYVNGAPVLLPLQLQRVAYSAVATGTTVTPLDDTIPQVTEGTEFMTLAITPKFATSLLLVEATVSLAPSTAGTTAIHFHRDGAANASFAGGVTHTTNEIRLVNVRFILDSVSVAATTISMRAGLSVAGTVTFNGQAGARIYGAVEKSNLTITEIL